MFKLSIFQSTRPSRGATSYILAHLETVPISIHAPLAGRDPLHGAVDQHRRNKFQSTRPSRGATAWAVDIVGESRISIHAPLAGRDYLPPRVLDAGGDFNPRAPRGARLCVVSRGCGGKSFQSTRPSRGATGTLHQDCYPSRISIHAPLAGRDLQRKTAQSRIILFQSTRPSRGATVDLMIFDEFIPISIHAPLAGRDNAGAERRHYAGYFNPRAPRGARRS